MIFSFGTTWRNEEQIVFLIRSIFRERRCCLWLYCLPGDRKCKVIEKKRKSAITSLWTFFCRVIWKPLTKRQMGWLRYPDIHHNEFGAYWYFQSILRLRGTETKQQAQNRFQGDFGIAFYRIFLPVLTIQCRICRWGGWVKIVGLWEESKFSSGLNSGSPSTCSHSDLMENYQTLLNFISEGIIIFTLQGCDGAEKTVTCPCFRVWWILRCEVSSSLREETLKSSESSYAWFPMVFLALNYHSFVYLISP